MSGRRTGRLERHDWLEIGLAGLGRNGPAALKIEPLCQAAGKTRGSFYHHFVDHDAFRTALLDHWSEKHTEMVVAEVERQHDPRARRHALNALAAGLDQSVEVAMRRLAASDDEARATVQAVDRRRIAFLAAINVEEFGLDADSAEELAAIEYATFVGFQMLFPDATERRYASVGHRLDEMIVAAGRTEPARSGNA